MEKYSINALIQFIFPWFWQTEFNLAFLRWLMFTLDNVNEQTAEFESYATKKVEYSAQKKSLENGLNIMFDSDLKRITIERGDIADGDDFIFNEGEAITSDLEMYIYNEVETPPTPPGETYWTNEAENVEGSTFTVFVPTSLTSSEAQIRAAIEYVLLYSTTYKLSFI